MQRLKLQASKRTDTGKTSDKLAQQGLVPGVVYGGTQEPIHISAKLPELEKLYHQAGTNMLVDVAVEGGDTIPTLFREVQVNPLKNTIRHFDLYAVDMAQAIQAEIPLVFTGDAPAAKKDAVILHSLSEIEVEAVPEKLPESIEVDLSGLEEIGDSITVSELDIPDDVELITDPETPVARAEEQKEEIIEDTPPEGEEPELIGEDGEEIDEEGADESEGGEESTDESETEDGEAS